MTTTGNNGRGHSNRIKHRGELMPLDIARTLNELRKQCEHDEEVFTINMTLDVLAKKVKDEDSVKHIETMSKFFETQYADPFVKLNDNHKKQLLNLCKYVEDVYSTLLIHTDDDLSVFSTSSSEDNQINHTANDTNRKFIELRCPVCQNIIDLSNKSLFCKKCGAKFCSTCEGWYREERKRGQPPLCESCYVSDQEQLRKQQERLEFERKEKEEEERLKKEAEVREKKELPNTIGIEFVKTSSPYSESERFNEGPVHKVTIPEAFYLTVTREEWKAVMGNNLPDFKGDDRPIVRVSWNDVQDFINMLNEKEGTDEYRIPSDAEWQRKLRERLELERKEKEEEERLKKEAEEREKKKLTNTIGMEFVKIPSGEFKMGSLYSEAEKFNEGPVHKVTIPEAFYLGKYPVTQKQWKAVMGNNPSVFKGDDRPIVRVSWNDVQDFINMLNEKEGTDEYRLPSEAEWEYACRAGTITRYSFGDDESKLHEYAWYSGYIGYKTHPVGKKKPNPWGLYDMHGNIREWVQDEWHDDYNGAPNDGSAWEDGNSSARVCRGDGRLYLNSLYCRSALRSSNGSNSSCGDLGFRPLRKM